LKEKVIMKKKATTTKLFVVVASYTQKRNEGNKTIGGKTSGNKHKPKPKLQMTRSLVPG
jgi:hypothetical protein